MGLKLLEALHLFSGNLVPDADFERRGNAACKRVIEILQRHRRDVDEPHISECTGKRTSVSYLGLKQPDFDIVLYLNIKNLDEFTKQSGPPFKKILAEFEEIFEIFHPNEITILHKSAANFIGIQVDDFRIDVAPAVCFKNTPRPYTVTQKEHQQQQTLELIRGLSNPQKLGHYYSPGLTESALKYVKREEEQLKVHPLICLAKFWARSLNIPASRVKYVIGQSYLMERMAIRAAEEVGNFDLISRLEKFLEVMSNFTTLAIFEMWYSTEAMEMEQYGENLGRRPIVLDPVNPYNNIALLHHDPDVRKRILDIFEEGAKNCLAKLKTVKERERSGRLLQTVEDVREILDQSDLESNLWNDNDSSERYDYYHNRYYDDYNVEPLQVTPFPWQPSSPSPSYATGGQFSSPGQSRGRGQAPRQEQEQEQEEGIGLGGAAAIGGIVAVGVGLLALFGMNNERNRRN